MSTTNSKKSNPLFEILFNVFIPSFILMKFSGDEHLGTVLSLIVALSFPVAYGGLELIRNKKFNFIAALGFVSVLLTGGIGLLELDTRWLAMKEALIPGLIGIAVLVSTFTRHPLMQKLIFNKTVLNLSLIEEEASTLFSFGHAGAYDHEDDITYLEPSKVKIVDIGDADIVHTDTIKSHANIEYAVRKILAANAIPVVMGGDHSVNIPCINAFDDQDPIHVVQIDAHLDFVDERHGVRNGHGNPMRRAAEKPYVTGLTQLGIRNVSSTAKEGYSDARAMGSDILSVRQCRAIGPEALLQRIPAGANIYVTIDIDAFCPSIAPGTGTPSHGGFLYYEVLELLQHVAYRNHIVGIDLVEVAPDYDPTDSTAILAAQVLLNLLGFIFHARAHS